MKFYVINQQLFNDDHYAYGEQVDQKTGDFDKCDICRAPISSRKWLPPLKVKLSKPSYGDFVFGTFSTFLASEHFKQKYQTTGLKGILNFEPVEITKVNYKKPNSLIPPQFYNVVVARSKTRVDEIKSKFVREGNVECDVCRSGVITSFEGVFLIKDIWDGKDIFFPTGLPGTLVVTQKFFDFVKNNKFTNIEFIPAEQYIAPWVRK